MSFRGSVPQGVHSHKKSCCPKFILIFITYPRSEMMTDSRKKTEGGRFLACLTQTLQSTVRSSLTAEIEPRLFTRALMRADSVTCVWGTVIMGVLGSASGA